jgi:hypothetical protein
LDLDHLRPGFLSLRQRHGQHALFEFGSAAAPISSTASAVHQAMPSSGDPAKDMLRARAVFAGRFWINPSFLYQ